MKNFILPLAVLCFASFSLNGQNDDVGNWIMYFGQNRISDKLSIHTEIQHRNHTIAPTNSEQLLIRTGLNFHIKSNFILTAGYGFIPSFDYLSEQKEPEVKEHRIFQQMILTNQIDRLKFEHRYRLEQRWVNKDYRTRFRYRLMAFIPINKKKMEPKALFIGLYDEIFVNSKRTFFDRNRLYGGLGYQVNKMINVQAGILRQQLSSFGKTYLQFGLTVNPDFRKKE